MRVLCLICIGLLTTTALAQTPAGQMRGGQTPAGTVAAVSGAAGAEKDGGRAELHAGDPVSEGAFLRTGPDARLRIDLRDGTTLILGADTTLQLTQLPSPGAAGPTRFTRLLGYLRAVVRPRSSFNLEIETDEVVAAVRGTEWIEHATADATEIFVADGQVALRGAAGPLLLAPGQGVTYFKPVVPNSRGLRPLPPVASHSDITRWAPPRIAAFQAATSLP